MPKLPVLSGSQATKVFQRLGFKVMRQKGSHMVLRRENLGCVVPNHKELAMGTLRGAIKQAGIKVEEFIKAYQKS